MHDLEKLVTVSGQSPKAFTILSISLHLFAGLFLWIEYWGPTLPCLGWLSQQQSISNRI